MNSQKNVVFGIVVFALGIGWLWWNEHRAVSDYKELHEIRDQVVMVDGDSISPANEGKVVHVSGQAATQTLLKDPLFDVEAHAIRLRRTVEMYQWQEQKHASSRNKTGGGSDEVVEFSYQKIWSDQVINSDDFRESGHKNLGVMQPEGWSDVADAVTLKSFSLGQAAIECLQTFEPYPVHRATLPEGARLENSVISYGSMGSVPDVGDRRVTFQVVPQGTVSVIAAQRGSELVPWINSRGKEYIRVQTGTHSAEEMLEQAVSEIRLTTWLMRLGGWLLMAFGMGTALTPFAVAGDVLPWLGRLIGLGIRFFSLLSCGALALLVIGLAWITARPLVGLPLLAIALGIVVWLMIWGKQKTINSPRNGYFWDR